MRRKRPLVLYAGGAWQPVDQRRRRVRGMDGRCVGRRAQGGGAEGDRQVHAHYGADPHLSGDTRKESLSRGMPIPKAMEEHGLIVFAMNGEPLPNIHGGPVRLVIPGWPGSLSHKWLTRIWVRDREHDGQGMTGTSYRVAIQPMVPGGKAHDKNFRILELMPVRSIVTSPANGTRLPAGTRDLALRGAAWAGDLTVAKVDVSIDFGGTWTAAQMKEPKNRYDWHRWTANIRCRRTGITRSGRELRMRTVGCSRTSQVIGTHYGGNAMHRVAVLVE